MMKAQGVRLVMVLLLLSGVLHGYAEEETWADTNVTALLEAVEEDAYQKRVSELEQQIADRDDIIRQMSDAGSTPTEQQARLHNLQDENRLLQERIKGLTAELTEVELERDQIRSDFNRLFDEGQFAVAAEESEDAGTEDRQAQDAAALEEARAELAQLQAKLSEAAAREQTLSADLKRAETERKELEAALQQARAAQGDDSQLKSMQAALEETRTVLDRLRNALEASQAENEALQTQLVEEQKQAEASAAPEALQEELATMRTVDAERKAAMDDLFRQLSALRGDMQEREQANVRLTKQVAEHEQTIATLEEQMSEAEAARDTLESEKQQVAASLKEAESEVEQLRDALADCEAAREKGRQLRARLESEVEAMEADALQQRKTLEATLQELALLRSSLVERTEAQSQQARQLDELRTALEDMQDQLAAKDVALEEAEQARQAVVAQKNEREKQLEEVRQQMEGLQNLIDVGQREKTALEAELERVKLVEDRRRRTLDETLEDLALAEQRAKDVEQQLREEATGSATGLTELEDALVVSQEKNAALTEELQRMEQELLAAMAEGAGSAEQDVSGEAAVPDTDALQALAAQLQASQEEVAMLREQLTGDVNAGDAPQAGLQAEFEKQIAAYEETILELEAQRQKLDRLLTEREEQQETSTVQLDTLATELAAAQAETEALQAKLDGLQSRDIRETDLYKELESANAVMREKLVAVEAERQRLEKQVEEAESELTALRDERDAAQARAQQAEAALEQADLREEEYKELLSQLGPKVTDLEDQITVLLREREAMAGRLLQFEDQVATLKEELEKREHRLLRAERVAEVLERARSEVEQSGRRQRLNMHYNMASVYARDGRFVEAEQEYLKALQLDPNDADVHYNLGVLYDDEMGRPAKAILHYRRYLQLNPHGTDADRVRNWLMRLELEQQNAG